MYLQLSRTSGNRIYLSIVHRERNPKTGRSECVFYQKVGYADELTAKYPDPVAHYQDEAKRMEKERAEGLERITVECDTRLRMALDTDDLKNFGYAAPMSVYCALDLPQFFRNTQRKTDSKFDANLIMQMLTVSQIIFPGSKEEAWKHRERFFECSDYSLKDVYKFLTLLDETGEALQKYIARKEKQYFEGHETLYLYDVTNAFFEIDRTDDLRKKGFSKENRRDPIVQVGLLANSANLPVSWVILPGNVNDCSTFVPMFSKARKELGTNRIIFMADKAMCTGTNIWTLHESAEPAGYIFSMGVRNASADLQKFILNNAGYAVRPDGFKSKSRIVTRYIYANEIGEDGAVRKKRHEITEKQVAFYSPKYAAKTRAERTRRIEKAKRMSESKSEYAQIEQTGAAAYVKKTEVDAQGEVIEPDFTLELDEEKIREEEKLDGYYVIATSEINEPDDQIIAMHGRQTDIEDDFRVLKTNLNLRPVFVSIPDHIRAHISICMVALLIVRIMRNLTPFVPHPYSTDRLQHALASCCYHELKGNIYTAVPYFDEILAALSAAFDIPFGQKFMTRKQLRSSLAAAKRHPWRS